MKSFLSFVAELNSANLIQINVAIITGLMIIATLQSFSSNSITDISTSFRDDVEFGDIAYLKYDSTIKQLELILSEINPNNTSRINHLQQQIDDLNLQRLLISNELEHYKQREISWIKHLLTSDTLQSVADIRITFLFMIMPFIASSIIEVISTMLPRYKDSKSATLFGRISLIAGIFGLGVGLVIIFTSPLM